MNKLYYVQYWGRGKWRKTYFGTKIEDDLHCYDDIERAKLDLDDIHYAQGKSGKNLTRYRIYERIYTNNLIEQLP